ncbi:FAD/NAD(P)-binding domain-containing protein [Periconia macrospinosa]|uniref:FAD/NAD(P)-binding domain-containing protein n=1 Tax=Periconia macrospinosa TaxID=97972 RepID=A0A2V1D6A9_9PLEO|nr:FAD/NAD(P)-binding domain-containing protein [Periconia macrospinosa]
MEPFTHIKRVAIIGAGPAGLAAVKYLKAESAFSQIVVFEQRARVGGVWNYTPAVPPSYQTDFSIPRTKPASAVETPWRRTSSGCKRDEGEAIFPSPIYDGLETNIPHTLMNFSDKKFPEGTPLFPPFRVVGEYLSEYAADIASYIRLGMQVHSVESVRREGNVEWEISYTDLRAEGEGGGGKGREVFDAVVVATGHYSDPYVPDIPGVREWRERYGGDVTHSKYYKNPGSYAGKKVVIVGNSASGIDISRQISTVASHILVSSKSPTTPVNPSSSSPSNLTPVPEITSLDPATRTLHFADNTTSSDIDSIVFCTGYLYSYPFLTSLTPPAITTEGVRTTNTYQHIFYHPCPSLAFLTLPQRIVPFPVAEAQAAYVARVFAGRLGLPTRGEMEEWEAKRVKERGESDFHSLGCPQDVAYINMLYDLSVSVDGEETKGKTPPFWDEEKAWTREMFPEIKRRALQLGEKRSQVRCLQDLGFAFRKEEKHG